MGKTIPLAISLIAFLLGSLFQLIVVGWLVFGSSDGPLWVGFFAPLGFLLYLLGMAVALATYFLCKHKAMLIAAVLNGALVCAFLGACFAYILFAAGIHGI